MLTYNTYSTPNLHNVSPFVIALDRKVKIIPKLEVTPNVPVSGIFKDTYTLLQRKLQHFRQHLQKCRDK